MKKIQWIVIISFIGVFSSVQAEVYKWTDSKGKIHFSDKPHANATEVKVKTKKPTKLINAKERMRRQKVLAQQFQLSREEKIRKQQIVRKKQDKITAQCNRINKQILSYKNVDYLFTFDDNGKKNRLSSQQKQQEINRLKSMYSEHCP
ncbi:MAG: DUF4124 domain-containing protein [Gammaproteobacteria bacterium]|nr:DUF4124 domain-containing protein [Gammaproteobacteria bacterium]